MHQMEFLSWQLYLLSSSGACALLVEAKGGEKSSRRRLDTLLGMIVRKAIHEGSIPRADVIGMRFHTQSGRGLRSSSASGPLIKIAPSIKRGSGDADLLQHTPNRQMGLLDEPDDLQLF